MSDLIKRADAIEAVRERKFHAIKGSLQTKPWYDAINEVLEILSALPSAEPCDKDAISREGLLKSWEELSPRGRTEFDQVIMTIPALPSAEAVQGWIPCSERLPEKSGFYLVSIGDLVSTYPFDGNNFRLRDNTCIIYVDAWKPLPEPYKPTDSEKE